MLLSTLRGAAATPEMGRASYSVRTKLYLHLLYRTLHCVSPYFMGRLDILYDCIILTLLDTLHYVATPFNP